MKKIAFLMFIMASQCAWTELSALEDLDEFSIEVPKSRQLNLSESVNSNAHLDNKPVDINIPEEHHIPTTDFEATTFRETGFTFEIDPISISIGSTNY